MSETKPCIACSEEIKSSAKLCKHCNTRQDDKSFESTDQGDEDFDPVTHWSQDKSKSKGDSSSVIGKIIIGTLIVTPVMLAGLYFISFGQSVDFNFSDSNQGSQNSSRSSSSSGSSGSSDSSGSSNSSGPSDSASSNETADVDSSFSEDILSDCLAYQNKSNTMQYPVQFLYVEYERTRIDGATTYVSAEFREIWLEQAREIDEKGISSETLYNFAVSRLTILCNERAGFILSYVY